MGELRINIADSLHERIKELARDNDVRLNDQVTALLSWAVDRIEKDRARAEMNQQDKALSKGRAFQLNGEPTGVR